MTQINSSQTGAGRREMPPEEAQAPRSKTALPPHFWLIAWGLVIVVLIASHGVWGRKWSSPPQYRGPKSRPTTAAHLSWRRRCERWLAAL